MSASPAEVEKQSAAPDEEEFRPPFVDVGSEVVFFPSGNPNDNRYRVTALSLPGNGLELILFSAEHPKGLLLHSVPHVNDPRLVDSGKRRERGAWDLTPDAKKQQQFKQRLERLMDRVCDLEKHAHEQTGFEPGYWRE